MVHLLFEKADWIWHDKVYGENEYAEFCESVIYTGGEVKLRVSVCGDYTLFINGKYVSSNQYGDFAHYKVYDEIEISDFLIYGKNTVCFLVWYFGEFGMRYVTPTPGFIYEVIGDDTLLACSSVHTYSRKSKAYKSGEKKKISPQLGYSFTYDATKEDGWLTGAGAGFTKSCQISKKSNFYNRPIKKLSVGNMHRGEIVKKDGTYLVDLGKEIVGMPVFSFRSEKKQNINIAYGEVLENGHVKRMIGGRDFSFDYVSKIGENAYSNYMFRCACRYIEIQCDFPIDIEYIGILPQFYPVIEKDIALAEDLDRKIYDICINTLKLCIMEHYVDCPWREQCMYAFDARNQMLSGYAAFQDGNFDYARANLLLMSKDKREDNLLSICFPSASDLTIPSFSLYFILAVEEYLKYSGDLSLGEAVFDKMESILHVFLDNRKDKLVCKFEGNNRWNFYDWSPNANFEIGTGRQEPDFLINCIVIIALKAYDSICQKLCKNNLFTGVDLEIAEVARREYYDAEKGLFFVTDKNEEPTEIANSLAVLSEIAIGDIAERICKHLSRNSLLPCSLSMKTFKFDAMIKIDKSKYKKYILDEIRQTYKIMIDEGTTTVWETIEGAAAFDHAGSLCHGWSAIPAYYYHFFKE